MIITRAVNGMGRIPCDRLFKEWVEKLKGASEYFSIRVVHIDVFWRNPAWRGWIGARHTELGDWSVAKATIYPDDRVGMEDLVSRAMKTQVAQAMRVRVLRDGMSYSHVLISAKHISAAPVGDACGLVIFHYQPIVSGHPSNQ